MSKKKKIRVEMRRNLSKPPRENDMTRQFQEDASVTENAASGERVRAKGDISRHRTIMVESAADADNSMPDRANSGITPGRVIRVHGLYSYVELDTGEMLRCTLRRVLKSMQTDERNIVTTGDRVQVQPSPTQPEAEREGVIERVEPRRGVLTRASRRREHVLVSNVDQLVIVASLADPALKPHLVDRYTALAEKGELQPIVCLNKVDLVDPIALQPVVGSYTRLGIATLLTSAHTGQGITRLQELLRGRATVISGQSGVGKSSLLNCVEPGLGLRVREISENTNKGQHTTTTAELIRLSFGGWVVDTPGVRQLQFWDTDRGEVEAYFREFRSFVPYCKFPDCTHTHEHDCAIKTAVRKRQISERRYWTYLGLFHGVEDDS